MRRFHDDVKALPVGASGSVLIIGLISTALGIVFLLSGAARLNTPGFRPAESVGITGLSVAFVALGVGLMVAYWTGYFLVFWLRVHSLYWAFWGAMFGVAVVMYGAPGTAIPVYFGLCAWSMLIVATVKQWRRIKGIHQVVEAITVSDELDAAHVEDDERGR